MIKTICRWILRDEIRALKDLKAEYKERTDSIREGAAMIVKLKPAALRKQAGSDLASYRKKPVNTGKE